MRMTFSGISRRSRPTEAAIIALAATTALLSACRTESEYPHLDQVIQVEVDQQKQLPTQIENHPLRNLPSTVIDIGQYTPIATETRHYISIRAGLLGSDTAPSNDESMEVTLAVPAGIVYRYHIGQGLIPQQTNELIDNAVK
ncbi:MAG: hypothetical protein JXO22_12985 [Phycisphaerae bacterium]|nr:hypothetical protein [Phycisphaerae bacterium]